MGEREKGDCQCNREREERWLMCKREEEVILWMQVTDRDE